MTDYTRKSLIAICEAAIVPQPGWADRDTPGAQMKVGQCWALLRAGCDFAVQRVSSSSSRHCITDENTIWLEVRHLCFTDFECGEEASEYETFYLPTWARLERAAGGDWY